MLNQIDFQRAVTYIKNNARDLDRILYAIEFENHDPFALLEELEKYQNEDGGYGKGIEPDIQLKESSILATTVACQYFSQLDVEISDSFLKPTLDYFCNHVRWEGKMPFWHSVPKSINDIPHPFWWTIENLSPPDLEKWSNPSAEVIGYLSRYSNLIDPSILRKTLSFARKFLSDNSDVNLDFFSYLCWKRSLPHLPDEISTLVFSKLDMMFPNRSELSLEKIGIVHPHALVTENSSYLFKKYPDHFTNLLNHEISEQGEDGGWHPAWSWETNEWDRIEEEWTGKLTVELLITLKYCNLLDQ